MGRRDELFVTAFRLAEHLDDLDAADVFHRRVVESLCSGHHARVVFAVARHHQHEKEHAQRQRGQRGQRHAPVKTEQINERGQRDDGIAAHFGDDVRQRGLHAVHALHEDVFQFAGAACLHVAQRHAGKFFKPLLADIAQHGKGRLMRLRGGQRMKQRPRKPHGRHCGAIGEIPPQVAVPGQQFCDHPRRYKIGKHLKRRARRGEAYAGDIFAFFLPGKGKHAAERAFFFFHALCSTLKIALIFGRFSSDTGRSS